MASYLCGSAQSNLMQRLYSQRILPFCAHLHPCWLRIPRNEPFKLCHAMVRRNTVFLVSDHIGKCSVARHASRLVIGVVYHSNWTYHNEYCLHVQPSLLLWSSCSEYNSYPTLIFTRAMYCPVVTLPSLSGSRSDNSCFHAVRPLISSTPVGCLIQKRSSSRKSVDYLCSEAISVAFWLCLHTHASIHLRDRCQYTLVYRHLCRQV